MLWVFWRHLRQDVKQYQMQAGHFFFFWSLRSAHPSSPPPCRPSLHPHPVERKDSLGPARQQTSIPMLPFGSIFGSTDLSIVYICIHPRSLRWKLQSRLKQK